MALALSSEMKNANSELGSLHLGNSSTKPRKNKKKNNKPAWQYTPLHVFLSGPDHLYVI